MTIISALEAGGSRVGGQPELLSETLSQKQKEKPKKKKNRKKERKKRAP
jgi:hypothetical protein